MSSQISLDGVQPRDARASWWSPPVLRWGAVRIILASLCTVAPKLIRSLVW